MSEQTTPPKVPLLPSTAQRDQQIAAAFAWNAAEEHDQLGTMRAIMASRSSFTAHLILTPASSNLLAHAHSLAAKGEHQFAVVFAHAACELHTKGELIRLLTPRPDKTLADLVMPAEPEVKSLANSSVCELYMALTGDNPTKADWWQAWQESRKDRHAVAHGGAPMTEVKSKAAIDIAQRYINHMTEKIDAALKQPPP